jgi:hypothetical protein
MLEVNSQESRFIEPALKPQAFDGNRAKTLKNHVPAIE